MSQWAAGTVSLWYWRHQKEKKMQGRCKWVRKCRGFYSFILFCSVEKHFQSSIIYSLLVPSLCHGIGCRMWRSWWTWNCGAFSHSGRSMSTFADCRRAKPFQTGAECRRPFKFIWKIMECCAAAAAAAQYLTSARVSAPTNRTAFQPPWKNWEDFFVGVFLCSDQLWADLWMFSHGGRLR